MTLYLLDEIPAAVREQVALDTALFLACALLEWA